MTIQLHTVSNGDMTPLTQQRAGTSNAAIGCKPMLVPKMADQLAVKTGR